MWGVIFGLAITDALDWTVVGHACSPWMGPAAQVIPVGRRGEVALAASSTCTWAGVPPAVRRALR